MGRFLASGIFLVALVFGVRGQSCSSTLSSDCYYTGAGTISAGSADSNKYFAVGGLFDIHEKEDGSFCGSKISVEGMAKLLAFYWSVDRFGKELPVPTNKEMKVGAVAFDNCMRPQQTIENMLSFSQCKTRVQGLSQQNVVAYVGPYSNMDAYSAGMLAQELKITLVSPSASSLELKRENVETLLRVRPSRKHDVKAIYAFLENRRAEFVLIVRSKQYQDAYDELEDMMKKRPIGSNRMLCNQLEFVLEDDATEEQMEEVVNGLVAHSTAKYVVPLLSRDKANELMKRTEQKNDQNLIYILHSDIGRDKNFVTEHAIIVEPDGSTIDMNVLRIFNDFLKQVNANGTKNDIMSRDDLHDPWLAPFLLQTNNKFPNLMSEPLSRLAMDVWRTIHSVNMIIYGTHKEIQATCAGTVTGYQFCDELRNVDDREDKLYKAIKGDDFGDDGELKPSKIMYNYYIYRVPDGYVKIGSIAGDMDSATITETLTDTNVYGQAFSGSLCPVDLECCHEVTEPPTTLPPTMAPTTSSATQGPSDSMYVLYPKDKEITGAFSNMDRDSEDYGTRFDLNQKWILALGVLAGLGILCVLVFEGYILFKMVGKKVDNKWRTMWLGQLLLFGIFLSYLVCLAFLFIPTKATCGITRFGVGVAYATCFAVLLVKLMVILTSKNSEVLLPGDGDSPNYLKGVYQFLMFVFAVGVQIVINVQWLITVPPEAIRVTSNSGDQVWVCNHFTWKTGEDMLDMNSFVRTNFENHLLSLTYIMIMIIIITILSLNAHGIITNHRESVFIGIAAGFSIPLWLAWGLVGGLNKDKDYGHEYGDACIAFGLFMTATLILFAMFLPKVRQLGNMGVEGIYLEDDRDTIYGGSIIMAPPSYKSKGGTPSSVIYVNNQGIYSEPVVVGNGDSNKMATYLKHPLSTYSAPPTYLKKTESTYGGSRVLRVTDDLKGRHPNNRSSTKKPLSEVNYNSSGRPKSLKGTLPRSRSQSDLGAL